MSKQMAFQFSGAKLSSMIDEVSARVGKVPKEQLEAALIEKFKDEKEREIARASIITLVKCYDTNRNYADVRNVIVWRGPDGKPGQIQIEFKR